MLRSATSTLRGGGAAGAGGGGGRPFSWASRVAALRGSCFWWALGGAAGATGGGADGGAGGGAPGAGTLFAGSALKNSSRFVCNCNGQLLQLARCCYQQCCRCAFIWVWVALCSFPMNFRIKFIYEKLVLM